MHRRALAFIAFVIGGIVMLALFWVLGTLGQMEAGMSAGAVPATPFADTLIQWLAVSYFVVSAIGILIARKRNNVRLVAAMAHLMLLVTFCLFCLEVSNGDGSGFILNVVKLAIVWWYFSHLGLRSGVGFCAGNWEATADIFDNADPFQPSGGKKSAHTKSDLFRGRVSFMS